MSVEQIVAALHALGAGEQADAEVRKTERQVMSASDDHLCLFNVGNQVYFDACMSLLPRDPHRMKQYQRKQHREPTGSVMALAVHSHASILKLTLLPHLLLCVAGSEMHHLQISSVGR